MKLTPFFAGYVKPARPGVYERMSENTGMMYYSRWNGHTWFSLNENVRVAADSPFISSYQRLKWRGLAKKPKGAK